MPATIDGSTIQAVFAQPSPDGVFDSDTLGYLKRLGAARPILFLAFAPKAAGTYFRQAAMHAVGGSLFRLAHALGGRDATPYLPNLLACYLDKDLPPVIAHAHMQALAANRNILAAFGIRPVIMLRDIPDMLASFWDMLDSDAAARAEGLNCVVPADFVTLSHSQKADFIVDVIAPWYISYFASWKTFVDETPKEVCVLRYRNFRQNPAESLHASLNHAGFVVTRKACETALSRIWAEREALRYNKGVEGRGKTYFSPRHIAEISRKLSHYPQLKAWMPDIMAGETEAREAPHLSRAAS